MWENLGRVMAETMQIDRILADPARIEIVSQNIHRRYKDKLGPAIGVSLHMGNWELATWPFTLAGNNPAAVYRTVKNPYVDQYLREARKVLYPGGLLGKGRDREEGQTTARRIMGFVRDGGRLGLVCDLHDRTGLPVPFFGKPAQSVTIPAMIARRARRAHLDVALPARGQAEPLPDRAQGAQGAALRQPGRRREMDHGRDAAPVRGLDPRGPRAVDVEQPALGLMAGIRRENCVSTRTTRV